MTRSGKGFKRLVAFAALVVTCAVLVACGGDDDNEGGDSSASGGETIKVTFVGDKTGLIGYLGKQIEQGMRIAVDRANSSGVLGDRKIELTVEDTTSDVAVATTKMSAAVKSDAVAIFGPTLSAEALALAPLAQQASVPFFTMSEATNLVTIGDHIFRIQSSSARFYQLVLGRLAKLGIKSANLVYASDNPALSEQAKAMPEQLKQLGIEVGTSVGVPSTTSDFSSIATRLKEGNPDAIGIWTSGSSLPSLATALRNGGYEGQLFADTAATGDVLKPAGSAADGLLYPVAYHPDLEYESSQEFTDLWSEAHPGTSPSVFAAFGYDEMTAFAEAMGQSDGVAREDVLPAMKALAESGGFEGAQGPTKFIEPGGRDVTVSGAVVEWRNGKEELVLTGEPGLDEQPLEPK